jgi:hypothetical protein
MSYQYQDPGIHRLTCDRHELERNLSLIGAELDQYSRNLRNLASALEEVVSGRESSDAHGNVFAQLSRVNPEGIRKLLLERSKILMNLAEIKTRIAARGV